MLVIEMHLNKKNNSYVITPATIITLAIMIAASIMVAAAPVAATTTTTTTSPPEAGLELSPQPIYQEVSRQVAENLINDTHVETIFTANGTLTLPNVTGETINTTSTGRILIAFMEGTAVGEQVINTEDRSESATAKFFGIARFNMEQEGTGRGIVIALVHTDSTGRLAPLDGMILAGQSEFDPEGATLTTLWEWQSGIPLAPPTAATTSTEEPSPLTDTATTATTNATSTDDTNAAATAPSPEEGGVVVEEEEQQTIPTILPAPNPLFE